MNKVFKLLHHRELIPLFGVTAISCVVAYFFRNTGLLDPDRYYHFAISKLIVQNHFKPVLSIEAVSGLEWNRFFPEKEFLFHILTSIAFSIKSEGGILFLIGAIFTLFNLTIFKILKKIYSLETAALSLIVFLPTQSHIFMRMNFVRPHTLAILLFFCLIFNLINKNKWFIYINGAICFLFSLSYHGFYLLFPPLLLFSLLNKLRNNNFTLKVPAIGFLSIACGIVLNPYFPGNVEMSIRHLLIALFETQKTNITFGQELIPWRSDILIRQAFWAVLGLGLSRVFYDLFNNKTKNWRFELVWYLSAFFWLLTLLNPRAQEFAIPLTLIAMGQIFSEKNQIKTRLLTGCSIFVISIFPFVELVKSPKAPDEHLQKFISFLKAQPEENIRVFNVDWDTSPYIMYAKPSFKFIDILDPSFLYVKNKELYDSREKLNNGYGIDPYGLIKATFNADWIEARNPSLVMQLEKSPDFRRIYPVSFLNSSVNGTTPFLFSLKKKREAHFLHQFNYVEKVFEKDWIKHSYLSWKPNFSDAKDFIDLKKLNESENPTPYFDLVKTSKERSEKNSFTEGIHCTYVTPNISLDDENLKAPILGIGGGRVLRVWVNDKPVFISDQAYDTPKLISTFIELNQSINTKTKVEVIVCSSDESTYMGLSLSLWTKEQIQSICEEKGGDTKVYLPSKTAFNQTNILKSSCLAPFSSQRNP